MTKDNISQGNEDNFKRTVLYKMQIQQKAENT